MPLGRLYAKNIRNLEIEGAAQNYSVSITIFETRHRTPILCIGSVSSIDMILAHPNDTGGYRVMIELKGMDGQRHGMVSITYEIISATEPLAIMTPTKRRLDSGAQPSRPCSPKENDNAQVDDAMVSPSQSRIIGTTSPLCRDSVSIQETENATRESSAVMEICKWSDLFPPPKSTPIRFTGFTLMLQCPLVQSARPNANSPPGGIVDSGFISLRYRLNNAVIAIPVECKARVTYIDDHTCLAVFTDANWWSIILAAESDELSIEIYQTYCENLTTRTDSKFDESASERFANEEKTRRWEDEFVCSLLLRPKDLLGCPRDSRGLSEIISTATSTQIMRAAGNSQFAGMSRQDFNFRIWCFLQKAEKESEALLSKLMGKESELRTISEAASPVAEIMIKSVQITEARRVSTLFLNSMSVYAHCDEWHDNLPVGAVLKLSMSNFFFTRICR